MLEMLVWLLMLDLLEAVEYGGNARDRTVTLESSSIDQSSYRMTCNAQCITRSRMKIEAILKSECDVAPLPTIEMRTSGQITYDMYPSPALFKLTIVDVSISPTCAVAVVVGDESSYSSVVSPASVLVFELALALLLLVDELSFPPRVTPKAIATATTASTTAPIEISFHFLRPLSLFVAVVVVAAALTV